MAEFYQLGIPEIYAWTMQAESRKQNSMSVFGYKGQTIHGWRIARAVIF